MCARGRDFLSSPPRYVRVCLCVYAQEHLGFYTIINGSIQTVVDLLVYLAMSNGVTQDVFVVAGLVGVALSVAYSLWFGARSRHLLEKTSSGYC